MHTANHVDTSELEQRLRGGKVGLAVVTVITVDSRCE